MYLRLQNLNFLSYRTIQTIKTTCSNLSMLHVVSDARSQSKINKSSLWYPNLEAEDPSSVCPQRVSLSVINYDVGLEIACALKKKVRFLHRQHPASNYSKPLNHLSYTLVLFSSTHSCIILLSCEENSL